MPTNAEQQGRSIRGNENSAEISRSKPARGLVRSKALKKNFIASYLVHAPIAAGFLCAV